MEIGAKSVKLGADWAPEGTPEFLISIPFGKKWDNPAGESISSDEIREIIDFVPKVLEQHDKVTASVEAFSS